MKPAFYLNNREAKCEQRFVTAINFYHLSSLNLFWGKTKQIANFPSPFFVALRRNRVFLRHTAEATCEDGMLGKNIVKSCPISALTRQLNTVR